MASSQWHLKSGNGAFLSLRKNMEFGLNSQMIPLIAAQWCNNVLDWGMFYFRLCQMKFRITAVKKRQPQSGLCDLLGDLPRYLWVTGCCHQRELMPVEQTLWNLSITSLWPMGWDRIRWWNVPQRERGGFWEMARCQRFTPDTEEEGFVRLRTRWPGTWHDFEQNHWVINGNNQSFGLGIYSWNTKSQSC